MSVVDVDKNNKNRPRKQLARRTLWIIIQTHNKMQEYLKAIFKNHVSISVEYASIFIQNASIGRVMNLETQNAQLGIRI